MIKLVIGNKNYSSWSLRAWLFLSESQLPFEEIRIPLYTPQWYAEIGRYGAAARVPILLDDTVTVWDTAAICDYGLTYLGASVGWPQDQKAGAWARSISAEMHAGYLGIRDQLPQNIRARNPVPLEQYSAATQAEIQRVQGVWAQCYDAYGGPWLFGDFSLADVFYAPVALRFVTYQTPLLAGAALFVEAVQSLPAIQQWASDSAAEPEVLQFIDELRPANKTELSLG